MSKTLYVKGDIITPTEGNDYIKGEPVLVLSDMTGDDEKDGFCNICIGKSGGAVMFWHNPECSRPYDGAKDSEHYLAIKAIKDYLFDKMDVEELARKVGVKLASDVEKQFKQGRKD